MMTQGRVKSRAAGDLGSSAVSGPATHNAPPPPPDYADEDAVQPQPGAIVSYTFCRYPLHMEEANPSSLQPRATRGRQAPPEKGDHSSHDDGTGDRLGNDSIGSIGKPMPIRPKQPDASSESDVRQDRGGFVDIGDSDNSNVSDTTTEGDTTSIKNRNGDRRRDFHDTEIHLEQDADEEQLRFVQCPYKGCAEALLADEMPLHIDLHTTLEYQKMQMPIYEVGPDAPIEDAYSGLFTGLDTSIPLVDMLGSLAPSLTEYRDEPKKPKKPEKPDKPERPEKSDKPEKPEKPEKPAQASSARSSSIHKRNDDRRRHRDSSKGLYLSEKESLKAHSRHRSNTWRAQSVDGIHDAHRERRERHRTGRDSASPHSVQQSKHNSSSHQNRLSLSSRPWWAVWALNAARKHSAATDKGKEVLAELERTPSLPRRLGKAELGKYANEERMPDKLAVYLKKEWGVCHRGMIPVLKQLLEQSPTTEYAYLCDPCVQHVSRLPEEGGFCGYRNLQTVISYILGAQLPGYEQFGSDLPSVFDLQNFIEEAWDKGINTRGRIETGGIRWTRKYIGTPEVVTLFRSLGISHTVRAFKHKKAERARDMLLREVEQYFQAGKYQLGHKVRATTLPPIYWQHPGHSLTIVGIEKTTVGETNLLVFDPIFREGSSIVRIVGRRRLVDYFPDMLLRSYRRGSRYLAKYRAFEIIRLQPKPEDLAPVEFGH